MKKRFALLALLVCVLMVSLALPASAATSGTCGDSLTWTLDNKVLTISGTGAMTDYTVYSEVPWYNYAFNRVVVEDGVTTIGNYAFCYGKNLTEVVLPEQLTTIGDYAFYSCEKLDDVDIPERVTTIGAYAFASCNLDDDFEIPYRVTTIGEYAFLANTRMTHIEIPDRVKTISARAFQNCTGLKSVVIPSSVTTIGAYSFLGCSDLEDVYYTGTETKWNSISIDTNNSDLTGATRHYNWNSSVASGTCDDGLSWNLDSEGKLTISGTGAMADYSAESPAPWSDQTITAVVVDDGITAIGAYAFNGCEAMTVAEIPASVTTVGVNAFGGCTALTDVHYTGFREQWDAMTAGEGNDALFAAALTVEWNRIIASSYGSSLSWELDVDGHLRVWGTAGLGNSSIADWWEEIRTVEIESGITKIYNNTFNGFINLESISIPESVTAIDYKAFYECDALEEIVLPSGITEIGDNTFYGCDSLRSVVIGDGVTAIGDSAFSGCSSLEEIVLPESVTSLGT